MIDEDGQSILGSTVGEEDVRQYAEYLRKRFRDAQLIWVELIDSFEVLELTDEEQAILRGEDI